MNNLKNTLVIITLLVLYSCSHGENDSKGVVFNNKYEANKDVCDEKGLPITKFSIEYPDDIEIVFPENGRDHLAIKIMNGNEVMEELWIGNTTQKMSDRDQTGQLLDNYIKSFESNSSGLKVNYVGEAEFNGSLEYQIQAEVDFSDFQSEKYVGIYKMILLIPYPKIDKHINAITVTMMANEDSRIKTFEDFQEKGIISKIWKTFKYIE